jgi:hypothetical protein
LFLFCAASLLRIYSFNSSKIRFNSYVLKQPLATIFYSLPFFAEQPIKCFAANLFFNFYRDFPLSYLKCQERKWVQYLLKTEVLEDPYSE